MISKVTLTAAEIKKGLGFNGTLEDINIAVMDEGNQVRYSVVQPKAEFLKALSLQGDVTEIDMKGEDINITVTGEVTGRVKRGRKAATP